MTTHNAKTKYPKKGHKSRRDDSVRADDLDAEAMEALAADEAAGIGADAAGENAAEGVQETAPLALHDTSIDDPSYTRLIDPDGRFAAILMPHVDALGYLLVKVEMGQIPGPRGGPVLQIFAEPKQKRRMGVEDCRTLSRTLSAILDVEDPISGAYMLEVSSPGIERALTRLSDFERFKGFKAKMTIDPPADNGQKRFSGTLQGLEERSVVMTVDDGAGDECDIVVDLDRITRAQLVYTKELQDAAKDTVL